MALSGNNPFKGLQPYGEQDKKKLFGREKDLILIKARIYSANTTLLFAGSGVGKTSFLNAKVIPEFKQQYCVFYHNDWAGRDKPLDTFKKQLVKQLGLDRSFLARPLSDILCGFRKAAGDAGTNALDRLDSVPPARCLLILDQFEEAFQYHSYEDYFEQFLDELCAAINDPELQVRIIFSMREEFLGELSVFDNRIPDLFNNYYRLKYPDKEDAKDIIAMTCALVDVSVDDAKLEQLVKDLSKVEKTAASYAEYATAEETRSTRMIERGFIVPPYLQITCRKLWELQFARPHNGDGTPGTFLEGYNENEAQKLLQDFCTEKLNRLNPVERYIAARAFNFLVTKQGAKMAYESKRLSQHTHVGESRLGRALGKLSRPDTRILRISRAPDGSNWYELYHDIYGPILDKWKQGFQRKLVKWTAAAFAGVTALLVLLLFAVPYWWTYPNQYKEIINKSNGSDSDYKLAEGAYNNLRATFGYGATANALWANYWERRAADAERVERREDALLYRLKALTLESDPQTAEKRRLDAGRLIKGDYGSLLETYHQAGRLPRALFNANGNLMLTQTLDDNGKVTVQVWNTTTTTTTGKLENGPVVLESAPVNNDKGTKNTPDTCEESPVDIVSIKAFSENTAADFKLIAGTRCIPHRTKTNKREVLVWNYASGNLFPEKSAEPVQWCDPEADLSVTMSPDGRYLATIGGSGAINVWDLDKVAERNQGDDLNPWKPRDTGRVRSLTFSPNGATLLGVGTDDKFRLWDVSNRQLLKVGKVGGGASTSMPGAAFSPDGTTFLTQHGDGVLRVWDAATGNLLGPPMETGYPILSAILAPDKKTVVALLTPNRQAKTRALPGYPAETRRRPRHSAGSSQIESHEWEAQEAEERKFSFYHNYGSNGIIQVWDIQAGKRLSQHIPDMEKADQVALSPGGGRLLVTTHILYTEKSDQVALNPGEQRLVVKRRGEFQLFDLTATVSGREYTSGDFISELIPAPDRKTLASQSGDWELQLWDAVNGTALCPPKSIKENAPYSFYGNVLAISEEEVVKVGQCGDEKVLASLPHPGKVKYSAYSPDGKTFVTLDASPALHFWDMPTYKARTPVPGESVSKQKIAIISESGKYVATVSDVRPFSLTVWDVTMASAVPIPQELRAPDGKIHAVMFSKDDRRIAVMTGNNTSVWELSSDKPVYKQRNDPIIPLSLTTNAELVFSNDGTMLLMSLGGNKLMSWDLKEQKQEGKTIEFPSPLKGTAFSDDGKSLLVFTGDWAHLYRLETNSPTYVSSRFVGSGWMQKILLDESGRNIRFFFKSPEGKLSFRDVRFDVSDPKDALTGEPTDLLKEWMAKLSLTFDQARLVPQSSTRN